MTTSWNETQQIEAMLLGAPLPGDAALFEAKLILDPELAGKMKWQQKTYGIIQQYGRHALKAEIESVHRQMFSQTEHHGFSRRIKQLFRKK